MSAPNTSPESSGESTGQGGEQPPAAAATPPAPEPTTEPNTDPEQLSSQLQQSNKQLKEAQARIAAYEKAAEEKAQAELTELEREKKRAEKAESELTQFKESTLARDRRIEFRLAATQAGVEHLDDLMAVASAQIAQLEIDDEGNVKGAAALVKSYKNSKPHFFKPATTGSGSGGGNPGGGPPAHSPDQFKNLRGKEFDEFAKGVRSGQIKL